MKKDSFEKAITMEGSIYLEQLLLALGFALTIIFFLKSKRTTTNPLPPGPATYPIVGCLPEMVRNKPMFRWIHKFMQDSGTDIACFRLGGIHVITVSSPDLARKFFKEHDAAFATRPECMTGRIAGDGYLGAVLSPGGDQWKKMRRAMVTEVLATRVHELLHAKRREEADHLVRYVYGECRKGGAVDVREAARLYCGCMVRKLVFGKRFFGGGERNGGLGFEEREHMDGVWNVLAYTYGSAIADYLPFMEMFDLDGHKKILTNAVKTLRKYQDVEVDNRVEMWRNGVRNTNEDILDLLISLKDSNNEPLLSTQEIKAQIIEISVAVIETPSNAVEWALAEMINEPRTLDLATKELDEIVGKNKLVQESDLPRMNYIKACAKEAMRLHPVAPFNLPHVSTADTVVGGYLIPKGSRVLVSRIGLGRNPRVWEDPLEFKPERHMADQVCLTDSELRMWTFSVGRRGCPAVTLGSTIITILLARLVQGFRWDPPADVARIDLAESRGWLSLAKPLVARATPRLEPQVYEQLLR